MAMRLSHFPPPHPVLFLHQDGNGPAFRGFVGERGEMGGIGQFLGPDTGRRDEFRRHAVSQGDGSRLVEEQDVHIACGFHGPSACGQHIAAHEPVNAGNPDGAEQPADRGGDQADDQGQQDRQ